MSTLWLLNGLWLYHMAYFMYVLPGRRGLHHLLWPTEDAEEAIAVYLAIDGWLAVIIVALWQWRLRETPLVEASGDPPTRVAPNGEQALGHEAERVPLTELTDTVA